jgi:hypothetical protein
METKEIAMKKRTRLLGTVCVLAAAFMAGPAAAASLTDWTGIVVTDYMHNTTNFDLTDNMWRLGGSAAGPLGVPDLNVQVDGSYMHHWGDACSGGNCNFSAEEWLFGGSAFWAGMDGRFGINVQYNTITHGGHITNGGVFGEYYFGNITVDGKAGWLSSGGNGIGGGHGNYIGGDAVFYALPDLAVTGSIHYADRITGFGCQVCGRTDINYLAYAISAEYLLPFFPVSISGTFAYTQFEKDVGHATTFGVRLTWYPGAPSLIDAHRNGTLRSTLTGQGISNSLAGLIF